MTNNSVVVQLVGPEDEGASTLDVVQLTPPLLGDWHAVMHAAHTEGQGVTWWESLAHLRYSVTHPHSRSTRFMFAAMRGGECVGALELIIEVLQPGEPVQVELCIRVDLRGRGTARVLASHGSRFLADLSCTTVQAEVFAPAAQRLEPTRSGDVLAHQGFRIGNVEDRLLLDLPTHDLPTHHLPIHDLTTQSWTGPCPTRRLNEQFGFRKVGAMHEAELRIADTH